MGLKLQDLLILCLFSIFYKLGLRSFLIRNLAFFQNSQPTYTFRQIDKVLSINQTVSSKPSTRNRTRKQSQVSYISEDIPGLFRNKSLVQYDEDDLRYHRISSFHTEDIRPYKVEQEEDFLSQSLQMQKSLNLEFHISNQELDRSSTLLFSKYNNPYKIKIITKQKIAEDVAIPNDLNVTAYYIKTSRGNTIASLFVQNTNIRSEYIIIHSHQNRPDLGMLLDTYLDLTHNLSCNVIGYDYSGFGQSTGKTDDISTINDIQAVYNFVINDLGFHWQRVLLYGQSIGSGPSITLAAQQDYPVGGLIIHSGFMSGLRAYFPKMNRQCFHDMFPNLDLIERVNCLIYILHGKNDTLIHHNQATVLADRSRNLHKIWLVEEGGHNNIEMAQKFRQDYFYNLREFLKEVMNRNAFYKPDQLIQLNRAGIGSPEYHHIYDKMFLDSPQRSPLNSYPQTGRVRNSVASRNMVQNEEYDDKYLTEQSQKKQNQYMKIGQEQVTRNYYRIEFIKSINM